MRIKNLSKYFIYRPVPIKKDGETINKWVYKGFFVLNGQQDISQLDVNEVGVVDFDRLKLRIDYDVDIKKNDGVSLKELSLDEDGYSLEPPQYKVIGNPKVGRNTTFTCESYHGK